MVGVIGLLTLISSMKSVQDKTSYTVVRVFDGDTFETAENQKVRLAGVEAPEAGLCGSEESKNTLEKMILNKKVQMKILYKDPFYRLVSMVYINDKFINKDMIASGWAYYKNRSKESSEELLTTNSISRDKKIGIFSNKCTQEINPRNLKCNIKSNNRSGSKEKLYHYPGCNQYNNTKVQLYLGDQWFCTEKEAVAAGYKKSGGCGDKIL